MHDGNKILRRKVLQIGFTTPDWCFCLFWGIFKSISFMLKTFVSFGEEFGNRVGQCS